MSDKKSTVRISKYDANILAEMDHLVETYAVSDEPMRRRAQELAETVRFAVWRWAKLCGYIGDGPEKTA